jgi:phosphate uptake regulator
MSNLDNSIGKLLLDLQKDDPETFKKLMEKAYAENPELFDDEIDEDNKKIDEYNRKVDEYNKKIEDT